MARRRHKIPFIKVLAILLLANLFLGNTPLKDEDFYINRASHAQIAPFEGLSFAGEKLPVHEKRVSRLINREIRTQSHWQGNLAWINTNAAMYFPVISPVLKEYGIPDDFKFLPMVESGFTGSESCAGAQGYWQLMPMAGHMGRLEMNNEVDERYHLKRSTEAACRVLKALYNIFHNWALVVAAYNTGVNNVQNALASQHAGSFYELNMNSQTTGLMYRLVALKEIYEHPLKYGYKANNDTSTRAITITSIQIDKPIPNLQKFAKDKGLSFKALKAYNPWMRGQSLRNRHKKTYEVYLPIAMAPKQKIKESTFAFLDFMKM